MPSAISAYHTFDLLLFPLRASVVTCRWALNVAGLSLYNLLSYGKGAFCRGFHLFGSN